MSALGRLARVLGPLPALLVCLSALTAEAQPARARYDGARARETEVREEAERVRSTGGSDATIQAARLVRRVVAQYEGVVRRFPTSGYSDNALYQAATLSQWLHGRFGLEADRVAALKYFAWLDREYPASPLRREAKGAVQALSAGAPSPTTRASTPASDPPAAPRLVSAKPPAPSAGEATPAGVSEPRATNSAARTSSAGRGEVIATAAAGATRPERSATLLAIDQSVVEGRVRVTLTLDRETTFAHEVLAAPPRAFVDLAATTPTAVLRDATLRYETPAVRQVRVGRRGDAARVVMDLVDRPTVSVFTLYNPFRIVIDAELASGTRAAERATPLGAIAPVAAVAPVVPSTLPPSPPSAPEPLAPAAAPDAALSRGGRDGDADAGATPATSPATSPDGDSSPPSSSAPIVPSANVDGTYSLARQLGLGVSRIVIDPGHGGHDPGTLTGGSNEARLVLDVALRLEKLLEKDGFDVVLTRRTDVFIPLEERTAIANREGADLFLSIHANSGRDQAARGIEVYYLSFASNPDAEGVAARENATAAGAMHNLPSIVRAIALNNKLDESRDFAQMVQRALASRLAKANPGVRDRGVKKAPFVVLIGANMPSVLAEIGFITNRQEAALIKTPAYRQRIAESLQAAVTQYQRALKRQGTVAAR